MNNKQWGILWTLNLYFEALMLAAYQEDRTLVATAGFFSTQSPTAILKFVADIFEAIM